MPLCQPESLSEVPRASGCFAGPNPGNKISAKLLEIRLDFIMRRKKRKMKTTKGSEGKDICMFNRQTCNEKASLQPDSLTLRRQGASVQLGARRGLAQLLQ